MASKQPAGPKRGERIETTCPIYGKKIDATYRPNNLTGADEWRIGGFAPETQGGEYLIELCCALGLEPSESKGSIASALRARSGQPSRSSTRREPDELPTQAWLDGCAAALRSSAHRETRQYLIDRGIESDTLDYWGVGYSLTRDFGPYPNTPAFVFPVRDGDGQLAGLKLRPWPRQPITRSGKTLKSLNLRGVPAALYPAPIKGRGSVLVVEGEIDALRASQLGRWNVVTSTCGTSWNPAWDGQLAGRSVAFVYDVGEESMERARAAAVRAVEEGGAAEAWAVDLSMMRGLEAKGADLSDFLDRYSPEQLRSIILLARYEELGIPHEPDKFYVSVGERITASAQPPPFFVMGGKDRTTPQFSPVKLGEYLVRENPAARGADGMLYAYHDDRWQADGEEFYRGEVRRLMGNFWRKEQPAAVVTWIMDGAARLDVEPPIDRIRVANGILRFGASRGKGRLEPHSVDPYTPVYLPVTYDRDAQAPVFRRFITEALSPELQLLAQEIMGYLLVPDNSQQKAILARGAGGNGKTTWVKVIYALLGSHNYVAHPLHKFSDARFATCDLYGKLANICADISSNELSSSATFRAITGGDAIMAEQKFCPAFKFVPFARLVFAANHYPPIASPTAALFERWLVLPFERRFRGADEEDKQLSAKMTTAEELSGILNYALAGLRRLREQGSFTVGEESRRELGRFRMEADTVALFVREELRPKPGFYRTSAVWAQYQNWITQSQHQGMNRNAFYDRLSAVVGVRRKLNGIEGWKVTADNDGGS